VSLLSNAIKRLYNFRPARPSKHNSRSGRWHKCRIEQMESRQLLSVSVAPIHIGSVYYEPHSGTDASANLIYITWDGGATGTYLKQIVINTDKNQDGAISEGECFFHTADGGAGVYGWASPKIVEKTGITNDPVVSVENGGHVLTITFTSDDFHAGGRLVLSIDVDEMGKDGVASATAEGAEFENSIFTATFSATHYNTATSSGVFLDAFDSELTGYNLNLPPDNYIPPSSDDETVYTAGLGMSVEQVPLPITISGYVYYDANNNGGFDSADTGISSVTVTLLDADGNSTGLSAVTGNNGYYIIDNIAPGTYSLAETQPDGYLEGAATSGSVGGAVQNPDLIGSITLSGGDNATDYDFGEVLPASISGKVFADSDNNNQFNSGDQLLAGVTVYLLDQSKTRIAVTQTDENGEYFFTDLKPGVYGTEEIQPDGYLEGADYVGSVGGTLDGVDRIIEVSLGPGVNGTEYNFSEIQSATISGYVFQDGAPIEVAQGDPTPYIPSVRNGVLTADDTRLAGVTLQLCDGSGYPLEDGNGNYITTMTDANGYYEFTGLEPGDYSVKATIPDGYTIGVDTAGSKGGIVVNSYATIDATMLSTLAVDTNDNAIVKIALNSGDTAVQYNFSVVKLETPSVPNGPIIYPNPVIPTPFPPPMPSVPDLFRYGVSYVLPPIIMPQQLTGGSGGEPGYTWHLSVIDGGQPRQLENGQFAANTQTQLFDPDTWTGADLNQGGLWIIADTNGVPVKKYRFGLRGAAPVTGDWNGEGVTKIGVFIDGLWFLDLNGDGVWDENDLWAKLGQQGDRPVTGDWDGDGKTDIGIFGPAWFGDPRALVADPGLPDVQNPIKNGFKNMPPDPEDATIGWRTMKRTSAGNLRSDLIDHVFRFGTEDDVPVTGDWNGDGVRSIGIFRNGTWFLDINGDGRWGPGDAVVEFGQEGDIPVVGDWTGDGITKLGVYRNGTFYLDTNNNHVLDATDKVFALGSPGDKPFAGDFTSAGVDTVGVYHDGAGAETVSTPAPTPAPAPAGK